MFWFVMSMGALAFVFAKLGAYSVLVKLLTLGLSGALVVIAGLIAVMFWRKLFNRTPR